MPNSVVIHICGECISENANLNALQDALPEVASLLTSPCLDACEKPVPLALQAQDGASYVFHGIDLTSDQADIAATVQAYLESEDGWIKDARPCGRLRFCLRARLPSPL